MDDLHRIEVILCGSGTGYRSLSAAMSLIAKETAGLESVTLALNELDSMIGYFRRANGTRRDEIAMRVARACRHFELVFGEMGRSDERRVEAARNLVKGHLKRLGQAMPRDLSWAN